MNQLLRHAPAEAADLFVASRVRGDHGRAYGTLPESAGLASLVERHRPLAGSPVAA